MAPPPRLVPAANLALREKGDEPLNKASPGFVFAKASADFFKRLVAGRTLAPFATALARLAQPTKGIQTEPKVVRASAVFPAPVSGVKPK